MTDPSTDPAAPEPPSRGGRPSVARIVVWIVVAGIGVYLIASGIVGMLAKA